MDLPFDGERSRLHAGRDIPRFRLAIPPRPERPGFPSIRIGNVEVPTVFPGRRRDLGFAPGLAPKFRRHHVGIPLRLLPRVEILDLPFDSVVADGVDAVKLRLDVGNVAGADHAVPILDASLDRHFAGPVEGKDSGVAGVPDLDWRFWRSDVVAAVGLPDQRLPHGHVVHMPVPVEGVDAGLHLELFANFEHAAGRGIERFRSLDGVQLLAVVPEDMDVFRMIQRFPQRVLSGEGIFNRKPRRKLRRRPFLVRLGGIAFGMPLALQVHHVVQHPIRLLRRLANLHRVIPEILDPMPDIGGVPVHVGLDADLGGEHQGGDLRHQFLAGVFHLAVLH